MTAVIITACAYAQAPEKISYQAVIRDGSNALVTLSSVGMQISILRDSTTGTAVYVETQTLTSNANGLVSLEIGGGTLVNGGFSTIDWSNGPYFVKIETDPSGGTNYTITGTSQLLSVPYALYAEKTNCLNGVQLVILSGTISSSSATTVVTHGLDASKISGLIISIKDTPNSKYVVQPYNVKHSISYWYDSSSIYIDRNGYDISGEPFKATIFYEY